MSWKFWKKNRKLRKSLLEEAKSERFLYSGTIPKDADESLAEAKRLLKEAGYSFCRRSSRFEHGRKFTMTLRRRIALSGNWSKYSTAHKAEILWHELVHVRQRKAWGHARFLARYITAEGRWRIEVPAYRESLRAKKAISKGYTQQAVRNYITGKIKSMRASYKLEKLDTGQYKRETQKIWFLEAA